MYPYEHQNPYYTDPVQRYSSAAQPEEPWQKQQHPKQKKGRWAGILCACLVASSAAGFGGGYLAASLAGARQPQPQPAVSAPGIAEPQSVTPSLGGGVMTVSQVVGAVSDSVVEISTEVQTTNLFRQAVTAQAAGSGVILSEDGYIVTNHHVIDGAREITVRLKDEQSYPAKLIGSDPQTDVAVIKIEADGLKAAVIGDSSSLQVGDDAIAIGNPLGELGGTVTNGIISATGREVTIGNETMNLLQTNAAINPGNSGGGLFNNRGELIGIVVAKSAGSGVEGLGFAIPIDTAKAVADDLIAHGYVTGRGELGISVIDINDQRAAFMYRLPQLGVYVAQVQDGSAAQRAGLKVGDGILAVDGEEVASSAELHNKLASRKAGETAQLTILRDSERRTVSVTLQENLPESAGAVAA